jgi:aminotransferase
MFVPRFARRVQNIEVSLIKSMPLKARHLPDVLSLGQGIPSLATPDYISRGVCRLLKERDEVGKYSLQPGVPELKALLARELENDNWSVNPEDELFVSAGGMEALFTALVSIVDEGDEVVLFDPSYASHIEQVVFAGGVPKYVALEETEGWQLVEERLRASIGPRTKAIIMCNPGNPTGKVFSREEIDIIMRVVAEHDLFLIADETYDFLTYGLVSFVSCRNWSELRAQIICCGSFSKRFAMTGWRLGYLHASAEVVSQALKVHDAVVICAPTIAQYAGIVALTGEERAQHEKEFLELMTARRNLTCDRLDMLSQWFDYVRPMGAYYVLARYTDPGVDSLTFADRLLSEAGVITIPGRAFGPSGEQHLRFSFGGSEDHINKAFDRIAAWLKSNDCSRC